MQYSHAISGLAASRKTSAEAACDKAGSDKVGSDEALIGLVARGDKNAMRVLYIRHNVRVFRFLLRLVGNEATAEELASEVFLDVWRHAGLFQGRSQVSTWILGIARNKALSARRRGWHDSFDDGVMESIADPADDPETATQNLDRSAILRDCLTQLSPAHREVIDLVYYHQRSVDEVAQIIGVPRNTVKTRLHYARKHLAELIAARGLDRGSL